MSGRPRHDGDVPCRYAIEAVDPRSGERYWPTSETFASELDAEVAIETLLADADPDALTDAERSMRVVEVQP